MEHSLSIYLPDAKFGFRVLAALFGHRHNAWGMVFWGYTILGRSVAGANRSGGIVLCGHIVAGHSVWGVHSSRGAWSEFLGMTANSNVTRSAPRLVICSTLTHC